ncbi:replication initiator protein A [Streptococcus pyogenes]|nr:replication initiator protein A [Streptococcus pyogenes]VHC80764.1 replication initiator protein A [Streptococcus pyogenes]
MKRISANHYQTSERYYKLPKLLFESDRYKDMKLEVKVAYAVLKDRLELSLSRGWVDEEGFIYLIYSNSKLMKLLGCSKSKLLAIKKSLRDYGLIEEVQQSSSEKGRLANKIYLGELEHEPTPVSNSDGGGVKKTRGQSQFQPLVRLKIVRLIGVRLNFFQRTRRRLGLHARLKKRALMIKTTFGDWFLTSLGEKAFLGMLLNLS